MVRSLSGGMFVLGNSADGVSDVVMRPVAGRKLAVVGEANIKNRGALRSSSFLGSKQNGSQ